MILFFLFLLLLTFHALLIFEKKLTNKYFIPLLINPILYFLFPFILKYFQVLKISIQNEFERKKQVKEIPKLIEYLSSYIKSGIQVSQAIQFISKKNKWSSPIQNALSQITNYNSQGMSFESSVKITIFSIPKNKFNHFLHFFLSSLRLGHTSGGNMVTILEKVKNKIESSILLDQKIRATTAQMRLQAFVISLAPFVLALVIWFLSPSYILFFFNNEIGNCLLAIMIILNVIGFYFLKLISRLN